MSDNYLKTRAEFERWYEDCFGAPTYTEAYENALMAWHAGIAWYRQQTPPEVQRVIDHLDHYIKPEEEVAL